MSIREDDLLFICDAINAHAPELRADLLATIHCWMRARTGMDWPHSVRAAILLQTSDAANRLARLADVLADGYPLDTLDPS